MQVSRREALGLLAAALVWLPATRQASALASRLHILIGQPGGSTVDVIDRAIAGAIRSLHPGLEIDIENAAGSSGRAALKALAGASGDPGLIGMLQNGFIYSLLAEGGDGLAQFNSMALLGALGRDQRAVMVTRASGIGSMADLVARTEPVILPTINVTSANALESLLVNVVTGSRIKPVPGFSGGERRLALLSGEGQAVAGSIAGFKDMIADGTLIPILRLNDLGDSSTSADLPLLAQFAATDEARRLVALIEAVANVPQLVIAPAGLTEADTDELAALFGSAAAKLQAGPASGYEADDVTWSPRHEAVASLQAILAQPEVGATLSRALTCGQALGDGGSCP